jgi:diguanylate cyclase (GGDEF)-like protein/PAS domain S-box-containing protein
MLNEFIEYIRSRSLVSVWKNAVYRPQLTALRIVMIYVLTGLFWIFFSDNILELLVSSQDEFTQYSIYKGGAFIGLTGFMLYLLVLSSLKKQLDVKTSLTVSEDRWKFALEGAGDGVWDWDMVTDKVFRSARWQEIYGYANNEIEETSSAGRALVHPDDLEHQIEDTQDYLLGKKDLYISEFRILCKDGQWKWTLSRGMVISRSADGKPLRMIGTHTDITERKHAESQLFELAHYDQITQLPNRVLFLDRFQQVLKQAQHNHQPITLMYLDLDRFKEVNDTLGHDMGDVLLKAVGDRLRKCVRANDTVARMGGDEFTLILNNVDQQGNAARIAQSILDQFSEPFYLGDEAVYISASIGISVYPTDGSEVEGLLKNADQAMYVAKQNGRNRYHYFTSGMQSQSLNRWNLSNDLRSAIAENQLKLHYQPIVNLATGEIHKAEALIRWQHPTRGLVSPADFIPIAEDTGMIIDIGDWVFAEAANQVKQWQVYQPNFQISVNRSPVQFKANAKQHLNWVKHLHALNLDGDSICIEITEGLLLDARDTVIQQLDEFSQAGIKIAIDDFGTGYSSLAYLRKFDIDYVKIDKSFTSNLFAGASDLALCEAIIVMAHKLGKKVIAEGIETPAQLDLLTAAGCDFGQGYLFSKAVPADMFENLIIEKVKYLHSA